MHARLLHDEADDDEDVDDVSVLTAGTDIWAVLRRAMPRAAIGRPTRYTYRIAWA